MNGDYIHDETLKDRILNRWRFDFWLEKGEVIKVDWQTCEDHKKPSQWASIGVWTGKVFEPIWDVFVLNNEGFETLAIKVKTICCQLGGRYAEGYKE